MWRSRLKEVTPEAANRKKSFDGESEKNGVKNLTLLTSIGIV